MADWSQYAVQPAAAPASGTDKYAQYIVQPTDTATPAAAPAQDPGFLMPGSTSDALVRGFSNGATLGLGNKIQAGIRSLVPGNPSYAQLRDEGDTANTDASTNHAGAYMGANILGGAPAALAAGTGGALAQAGKFAALGAAQGAGQTADSTGGVAANMGIGAGTGAVLSGLGSGVGALIGKATQVVKDKLVTGPLADEMKELIKSAKNGDPDALTALQQRMPGTNASTQFGIADKTASDLANGTNPGTYLNNPGQVVQGEGAFKDAATRAALATAGAYGGQYVGDKLGAPNTGALVGGVLGGGMKASAATQRAAQVLAQKAYLNAPAAASTFLGRAATTAGSHTGSVLTGAAMQGAPALRAGDRLRALAAQYGTDE